MIKDINSMTREELILALEKERNSNYEAGKRVMELEETVGHLNTKIKDIALRF